MPTIEDHHAELIGKLKAAPVTVEDLARAWASVDGRVEDFDNEKGAPLSMCTGTYVGFVAEAEELIRRAVKYADARNTVG